MEKEKFKEELYNKFNTVLENLTTKDDVKSFMRQEFIRDFYLFINKSTLKGYHESAVLRVEMDEMKCLEKFMEVKRRRINTLRNKHSKTSTDVKEKASNHPPCTEQSHASIVSSGDSSIHSMLSDTYDDDLFSQLNVPLTTKPDEEYLLSSSSEQSHASIAPTIEKSLSEEM